MSDVLLTADQVADTVRRLLGDRLLTRDQVAELERLLRGSDVDDRLLSADEVAAMLHVSRRYVLRLARQGVLERVKRPGGKVVLFREASIQDYIDSGRQAPVRVGASAAVRVDETAALRQRASSAPARRKRFP